MLDVCLFGFANLWLFAMIHEEHTDVQHKNRTGQLLLHTQGAGEQMYGHTD